MHSQPMREILKCHTIRVAGRLALALGLALPMNFAAARPKPAPAPVWQAGQISSPQLEIVRGEVAGAMRPATAAPRVLSGYGVVIDGDTLDVAGERVRLEGIDAPERGQSCLRKDGKSWRCGRAATRALRKLVRGRVVKCAALGRGVYGRILGACSVGGVQINAQLVRRGLAWAFVKYSNRYVGLERIARSKRLGIWQGRARTAWEYRSGKWDMAQAQAPEGCAIKGNISRRGRIYHMPWNSWYGRVKIDPAKGERWFCSQADAEAAGWRGARSN